MTDHRKKEGRGEPTVEFRWDPLQLASDKTFSTTVRIFVSGWWPEGRPTEVSLSYYEKSQQPADGVSVRIQKGRGTFPLTGLEPGKHYHVVVYIKDRLPVYDMIMVSELPKPKRPTPEEKKTVTLKARLERVKAEKELDQVTRKKPGQEALELEQTELARAKVAHDTKELTQKKPKIPKLISVMILGERGRQKLLISVSADDDSLIPGFMGSVQDGSTLTVYTTGDNGTAVYEANFQELSRPFEIRAGNQPDLIWRARLLGPKTER